MEKETKAWKENLNASADAAPFKLAEQTFAPLGALVVVQILERSASRGGILIPNLADGKVSEKMPTKELPKAVVVAAGPQCRCVRRGDVVLWNGNLFKFEHDGPPTLWFGQESQIIGVERNAEGRMPSFEVKDWETGEIERRE